MSAGECVEKKLWRIDLSRPLFPPRQRQHVGMRDVHQATEAGRSREREREREREKRRTKRKEREAKAGERGREKDGHGEEDKV
jgi:hypothetical protein